MNNPAPSPDASTHATPQPTRVTPAINGYTLLRRLGMGGMGGVFLARQLSVDREVAVKILAPRLAKDQQFVERFLREARAAANLSHPNLIHVYDCGSCGRWHYFSMEYVAGRTLKQTVTEDGPLSETVGLQHMRAIAEALSFAHARGIVHRDVKPENIILSADGHPKLADLGLAKLIDDVDGGGISGSSITGSTSDLTLAGSVMGTPQFMSPEQASRLPIDARSDLYSLGATLFWLLTGQPPFTGESPQEVMRHHVFTPPPSLRSVTRTVSRSTESLVLHLMAKRPEDRLPDAAAVIAAISRILDQHTGGGRPGPRARAANHHRSASRPDEAETTEAVTIRKTVALVASAVVVAIIIGLGVFVGAFFYSTPSPNNDSTATESSDDVAQEDAETQANNASEGAPDESPNRSTDDAIEAAKADARQQVTAWLNEAARLRQRGDEHLANAEHVLDAIPQPIADPVLAQRFDRETQALATARRRYANRLWEHISASVDTMIAEQDFDAALRLGEDIDADMVAMIDGFAEAQASIRSRADQAVDALLVARRDTENDDVKALETLLERVIQLRYSSRHDDVLGLRHELQESITRIREEQALEIQRRWKTASGGIVEHLLNGRLSEAQRELSRLVDDRHLRALCPPVESVISALIAYHGRAATTLRPQIGQATAIATRRGTQRGTLTNVDDERGVTISIDNRNPNTGMVSQAVINIAWNMMSPQMIRELAGTWPDDVPNQLARAIVALQNDDHDSARKSLASNREHPLFDNLAVHLSDNQTEGERLDETEISAAFRDIQRRFRPRMSSEDALSLLQELEVWRQAHAHSEYRRSLENRDQDLRVALHQIAHPNLVPNGDFEGTRLDGWESRGSAQASLTQVGSYNGRQHLRLYGSGRERITHRVSVEINIPEAGSYDFSAWVRSANISTDGTIEVRVDDLVVHNATLSGREGGRLSWRRWRQSTNERTGGTHVDYWQSTSASISAQPLQTVVITITASSSDTLDLRIDDVVLRPQLR